MKSDNLFPIKDFKNTVFLKPLIAESEVTNVHAGDFSYYSDFDDPTEFLTKNVLYNFGISGNSLHIGKFCAFANGVQFIMPDANHATSGITTYPFAVFGEKWAEALSLTEYPFKAYRDTVIDNDVWLGYDVTIMPGVNIGHGSIIGAKSVVSTDIPPYSIAVGNPAKVVKTRFSEADQEVLLELAWWDWEVELIEKAMPILVKGDIPKVLEFAKQNGLAV
ncbi:MULTISPECIES: CatB-related O-acetyltransferase [unclassified Vibrio]|uniref:CatB-related O-acetyltransferase n=1 Tax=unclassified Vibrio TaxID=2614977 RepID=UPI0025527DA4|nr:MULTISPECIES: CatB-related O-acetyltransferase [unclassified Vibrio]MDK9779699.1 CatB-related O-acetyltransferase [Vibrio sp. D401a]MDK9804513.1 CatB-related O-acetyltransferase [Vibrio sp. D406a]